MGQVQFVHETATAMAAATAAASQASLAANSRDRSPERLPGAVLSIFANEDGWRAELGEDAAAAGFGLRRSGPLAALLEGEAGPIGDIVAVHCPELDEAACAALVRLDERAMRSGAQLVVATRLEALDEVFACLDQSRPQILVAPTRAEWLTALGRALSRMPRGRVRELDGEDRLTLLRLSEQVDAIAARLERMSDQRGPGGSAFAFASPEAGFRGPGEGGGGLTRTPRSPLPDPRLVRRIIEQRRQRSEFFDAALFSDPAWDILLDLTAARAEHKRVSVTSLCIASGAPATTALRWIGQLTEAGLLVRQEDDTDRRRVFIALTDQAADAMARYFAALDRKASSMV